MKKILMIILSICSLVGATLNVFAADSETNASQISVPVTYNQSSSYSIYIPETIDMSNGEYIFTASILDITSSQKVIIKSNADVTMTNSDGETGSLYLHGTDADEPTIVAMFEKGNLNSVITMYGQFSGSAGEYSGTAVFDISIR